MKPGMFLRLDYLIERLSPRIFENERRAPLVSCKCDRPGSPRGIEFSRERPFVFQPAQTLRRRLTSCGRKRDHRRQGAGLPATVKREARFLAKGPQHVPRVLCHRERPPPAFISVVASTAAIRRRSNVLMNGLPHGYM